MTHKFHDAPLSSPADRVAVCTQIQFNINLIGAVMRIKPLPALLLGLVLTTHAHAAPSFVNGLALDGAMLDKSGGHHGEQWTCGLLLRYLL